MSDGNIRPGNVKLCSLREPVHAHWAAASGADLFGLIFVPGVRRRVSHEIAREIVATARSQHGSQLRAVGVFVDASPDEINQTATSVGLNLAQLHGQEPAELIAEVRIPVVKALRPHPGQALDEVLALADRYLSAPVPPVALLVDGYHASHHGGEGLRADWVLAAELASRYPLILAGGLDADNVADAIQAVRPLAVDVSSGVESDGIKDPAKMAAFVRNAKTAFCLRTDR